MAGVCIFEDEHVRKFYPLTLTRAVYELRCGIKTLLEKIQALSPEARFILHCRPLLAEVVRERYPESKINTPTDGACLFINGRVIANEKLRPLFAAKEEQIFINPDGEVVGFFLSPKRAKQVALTNTVAGEPITNDISQTTTVDARMAKFPWELIKWNSVEIARDFVPSNGDGVTRAGISRGAHLLNEAQISIASGSMIKPGAVLDATEGPICIEEDAIIYPNSVIVGPSYIGTGSTIKSGAKIYEGTSIGPYCKIGGELEASIVHGYSNKQHEGFLGHAYLGEWINLGAGTSNSDLKNNYSTISMIIAGETFDTGEIFAGLLMGDHSKCAINTSFNTGTVVGVMSLIHAAGFPPKSIPSFWWGDGSGPRHDLDRALATADIVKQRRGKTLSAAERSLFTELFRLSDRGPV